jgi:hypothetical protein
MFTEWLIILSLTCLAVAALLMFRRGNGTSMALMNLPWVAGFGAGSTLFARALYRMMQPHKKAGIHYGPDCVEGDASFPMTQATFHNPNTHR